MKRLKNIFLVVLALSLVALAISQYNTGRAIAQVIHPVTVVNRKQEAIPVVQVTQWEYKTASCAGTRPTCYANQFEVLGREGWELISVTRQPEFVAWDFIFKRPKQ